ncbi:hypothetical protein [Synechococcus sp. Cu2B8-bc1011]|uniref:hypothetical protein n=1 Tax=Synechococcus sp. Cu2B8-bc1011 TaxID=3093725 RepID=UPI0039AEC4A5
MFLITIAIAFLGFYAPANAEDLEGLRRWNKRQEEKVKLGKKVNSLAEEVLEAAKNKDWKLACNKFNESTLFRQEHGLDIFQPLSAHQDAEATHKYNKLIAQANAGINKTAELLCGKAGMKAVLNTAKAVYIMPAPVMDNQILSKCRNEWGDDYVMIKYCGDSQTKAKEALGL